MEKQNGTLKEPEELTPEMLAKLCESLLKQTFKVGGKDVCATEVLRIECSIYYKKSNPKNVKEVYSYYSGLCKLSILSAEVLHHIEGCIRELNDEIEIVKLIFND